MELKRVQNTVYRMRPKRRRRLSSMLCSSDSRPPQNMPWISTTFHTTQGKKVLHACSTTHIPYGEDEFRVPEGPRQKQELHSHMVPVTVCLIEKSTPEHTHTRRHRESQREFWGNRMAPDERKLLAAHRCFPPRDSRPVTPVVYSMASLTSYQRICAF